MRAGLRRTEKGTFESLPILERLVACIERTSLFGCWEWKGNIHSWTGYGRIRVNDQECSSHRFVYELLRGPIPKGLTLDHLCRNKTCVNPDHLEPVTAGENALRGFGPCAVNARKIICLRGHRYDENNTYIDKRGRRSCKQCRAEWARKHRPTR